MARKTHRKPRATGAGAIAGFRPVSGLHAALSVSLALLDKPNAPASAYRIAWGHREGRTVIVRDTPRSLELQARYWIDLTKAVETLGEAASAVADWRAANSAGSGGTALTVMADHLASLAPTVHERVQTIIDLSPTLRAAMHQVEARQTQKREAA